MVWDEVKKAFKEGRKIRVNIGGNKIDCLRIQEIGIKRVGDEFIHFVNALDMNGDSLYCVKQEDVEEI